MQLSRQLRTARIVSVTLALRTRRVGADDPMPMETITMRPWLTLLIIAVTALVPASPANSAEPGELTALQQEMVRYVDSLRPELVAVNQDIWDYAELGLQEHRSAARLVGVLKKAGFRVREGVSD